MELQGKRAFITGGSKGIGAAIAIDLAKLGCHVAINGRNDDDESQAVLQAIEQAGSIGHMVVGDVAKEEECNRCVDEAAAAMGGLDILVHSAGGPAWGNIEDCQKETWLEAFDIHVHAAYYLCRRALPLMRKNSEGAILLISSVAGIRGVPNALAYATVKGAVLQFTRSLARDTADDNIRVNCLAPGVIRTRFHDAMTPEAQAHNLAVRIPLHREGTPQDVAEAARMMLTNEFITGETIVIDGGTSMQVCR
ncbi:General stress protein 39 [Lignipirellula cremea]|uniref:General stress protein 39 n=2 Tax=Lignipirellula cremea TaxID=2528010 RepID=A0A518DNK7_9BACT|nr:General stress protein 39 [Lignipirellula cremea]